jgi:hypothetical protein
VTHDLVGALLCPISSGLASASSSLVPVRPAGSLSVMDMDAPPSRICFAELPLEIQGRILENLLEPKGYSTAVRRALFVCKAWQASPSHVQEGSSLIHENLLDYRKCFAP